MSKFVIMAPRTCNSSRVSIGGLSKNFNFLSSIWAIPSIPKPSSFCLNPSSIKLILSLRLASTSTHFMTLTLLLLRRHSKNKEACLYLHLLRYLESTASFISASIICTFCTFFWSFLDFIIATTSLLAVSVKNLPRRIILILFKLTFNLIRL